MATERPATPEKQLLNLIEEPRGRSSLQAAAIKRHGLSIFSLGALKGRFAFFKDRFQKDVKEGKAYQLDVKALNSILRLVVLVLAVYFSISLTLAVMNSKKILEIELKGSSDKQGSASQTSSFLKAASYYLEKARERDIFRMGMKKTPEAKGPSQKILDVTQGLRLVGISWSEDPDVMIEDTKVNRTYFLKKGQTVENIKLEAVFKDKVILSYAGEEIELK
ncbi:MAG: hypothetical protein WCL25_04110 [bacterium]